MGICGTVCASFDRCGGLFAPKQTHQELLVALEPRRHVDALADGRAVVAQLQTLSASHTHTQTEARTHLIRLDDKLRQLRLRVVEVSLVTWAAEDGVEQVARRVDTLADAVDVVAERGGQRGVGGDVACSGRMGER